MREPGTAGATSAAEVLWLLVSSRQPEAEPQTLLRRLRLHPRAAVAAMVAPRRTSVPRHLVRGQGLQAAGGQAVLALVRVGAWARMLLGERLGGPVGSPCRAS